jgi:hypothetical protein
MADKKTISLHGDAGEYETVKVDSRVVTDLKAYLLTRVLPFLTDLPDYQDSEDYRNSVLSTWIETAIRSALEEEGFPPKNDGCHKRSLDAKARGKKLRLHQSLEFL